MTSARTLKSPSKRQLAQFDKFWSEESSSFKARWGETVEQTKARILDYYTWLWEGAGRPRLFIPKPMDLKVNFGSGRADRDSQIANFDQETVPNRKWTL